MSEATTITEKQPLDKVMLAMDVVDTKSKTNLGARRLE